MLFGEESLKEKSAQNKPVSAIREVDFIWCQVYACIATDGAVSKNG
jgi:hypothetical protein